MSSVHENLKYGDLIYIEFYDYSKDRLNKEKLKDKKQKEKYTIKAEGFSLKPHSDLSITRIPPKQNLKHYENKLFIIFPPLNEKFLNYKIDLEDIFNTVMAKLNSKNHIKINKEGNIRILF